ncbi:MAG: hypothetical protein L6406_14625 [Desulfobacterales bacterium]|nr:hypothetical protein [Desulfobacterales bacterium]
MGRKRNDIIKHYKLILKMDIAPKFVDINRRHVIRAFSYTAVFNTAIALFLTFLGFGSGFYEENDPGTGLSNIRERLQSIYSDKGRLILLFAVKPEMVRRP